jgi:hypothetical protein
MPKAILISIYCFLIPTSAYAYIGPGLGAGAIAAIIGIFGAILLTMISIVYYPIKRLLKNKRKKIDDE